MNSKDHAVAAPTSDVHAGDDLGDRATPLSGTQLFSDQSTLTYISPDLREDNLAKLVTRHGVTYDDLHGYQKPAIDRLIELGVMANSGTRIQLARSEQFRILHSIHAQEAASYFHLSPAGRVEADDMVTKGWLARHSTLLTAAEARYFDYFLNNVFSNGPQLRNRYMHGKQANTEGKDAHFHTYMVVLRLTMALLIKLNDDFCLAAGTAPIEAPLNGFDEKP